MSDGSGVVSAPPPDLARLAHWLREHVPRIEGLQSATRIVGGNSNPIWRIEATSGRYILRTQPAGTLLKSAHALDREVRVLSALQSCAVPVPRLHVFCSDASVIGLPFYLMDFVEGTVWRDIRLPGATPALRRAIYLGALDTLATVHRCDVVALGLADFGRPGNYFERQLHRWTQQYRTAMPQGLPALDALIDRLRTQVPADELPPVLLHGDCRLDNLMFAPGSAHVRAVLDWELSTLGHPLADLGQFLGVQELPADYLMPGLAGVDREALGIPTQREQAAHYLRAMGLPPDTGLRFFKAFALFRQAAMSAGLLRRALEGTAGAESALAFGRSADVFALAGLRVLDTPDPA